ncbi:hypothetical protein CALCODRAFT_522100 [Calocera cornea HHB12733]|uniref:Uncharacterized protein n=1 Tax=Calocera cornea HHB12733 TaxID=1353952 RepID=A0A165C1W7_9BASI|nr:hypothetical protein CALCODRAFT_522100 [Calocera cornea HHB12733]
MTHFLATVGYPELIKGFRPNDLCGLVRRPDKGETELVRLEQLFRSQFKRIAGDIRLAEHTDRPILVQLGSDGGPVHRGTLFRAPQQDDTTDRYAQWAMGLVALLIRSQKACSTIGYRISLGTEAQAALSSMREALSVLEGVTCEEEMWRRVRALLIVLLVNDDVGVQREEMSVAQHYIMLTHLKPDGRWEEVRTMPPRLAGLTWSFRAIVFDEMSTRREGRSRVRVFQALEPFFRIGKPTMFAAVRDLQSCASSFTLAGEQSAEFEWLSSDTLCWKGHVLSFEDVRQAVAAALRRAWKIICDELLGGVTPADLGFQPSLTDAVDDEIASANFGTRSYVTSSPPPQRAVGSTPW